MSGDLRVRVGIWGREAGMLREGPDGRITFEYNPAFRASGLEISPIHLPTARQGPASFPELARKPAFLGLPGVFADALPDQFGNAVIRRYFEEQGRPDARTVTSPAAPVHRRPRHGGAGVPPSSRPRPGHRRGAGGQAPGRPGPPGDRGRRVGCGAGDHAGRRQRRGRAAQGADSVGPRRQPGTIRVRAPRTRRGTVARQVRWCDQRSGRSGDARRPQPGSLGAHRVRLLMHGLRRRDRDSGDTSSPRRRSCALHGPAIRPVARQGHGSPAPVAFSQPGRPAAHRFQRPVRLQLRGMVRHDARHRPRAALGERGVSPHGLRRGHGQLPRGGREIVGEVAEAVAAWRRHAGAAGVPDEMVEWVGGRLRTVAEADCPVRVDAAR